MFIPFVGQETNTQTSNLRANPDSKVHGANMGPTWVLLASDGPHVGPMNFAIREVKRRRNRSPEVLFTNID